MVRGTRMTTSRFDRLRAVLLASFVLGAAACSSSEPTPGAAADGPPAAISASASAEATKIFQSRCSPCHGAEGKGDGPTSKGLNPRPRNLQDAAWQTAVSDADIERIIQLGGAAAGKSPLMPPNPDLSDKPEVIKALRAHIRGLRH